MKFFSYAVALLPALVAAGPLEDSVNMAKRAELNAANVFAKRAACNTDSIVNGLVGISSSVAALSASFATLGGFPPCTSVNLTQYINAVNALTSKINSEATSISLCNPGVGDCSKIQSQFTSRVIPGIQGLSSVINAKSNQVSCNNLKGVLTQEAKFISSAVVGYGAAITPKLPAGTCVTVGKADIASVTSIINSIITQFTPP